MYATAERGEGFCCDNGNGKIEIENPLEAAREIMNFWKEDSPRGKVLQKYSRQINTAFALAFFCTNEVRQSDYNPSYIIKGTTYMQYGDLHLQEGRFPSYAQIYLYYPEEDNSNVYPPGSNASWMQCI